MNDERIVGGTGERFFGTSETGLLPRGRGYGAAGDCPWLDSPDTGARTGCGERT